MRGKGIEGDVVGAIRHSPSFCLFLLLYLLRLGGFHVQKR